MPDRYPAELSRKINRLNYARRPVSYNAEGVSASFVCGVSARLYLLIDRDTKEVADAGYLTNGCGYLMAAMESLVTELLGKRLTELKALEDLEPKTTGIRGGVPETRRDCIDLCYEALSDTLRNFRHAMQDEWQGETALICSCFGVSEKDVVAAIRYRGVSTVEAIGEQCRAGTGCGSCRMLLLEFLEDEA